MQPPAGTNGPPPGGGSASTSCLRKCLSFASTSHCESPAPLAASQSSLSCDALGSSLLTPVAAAPPLETAVSPLSFAPASCLAACLFFCFRYLDRRFRSCGFGIAPHTSRGQPPARTILFPSNHQETLTANKEMHLQQGQFSRRDTASNHQAASNPSSTANEGRFRCPPVTHCSTANEGRFRSPPHVTRTRNKSA